MNLSSNITSRILNRRVTIRIVGSEVTSRILSSYVSLGWVTVDFFKVDVE